MSETYLFKFYDGPLAGDLRECYLRECSLTVVLRDYPEYVTYPAYHFPKEVAGDAWGVAVWRGEPI